MLLKIIVCNWDIYTAARITLAGGMKEKCAIHNNQIRKLIFIRDTTGKWVLYTNLLNQLVLYVYQPTNQLTNILVGLQKW